MKQSEIDEISTAFMDAWEEYFGMIMYYVPFDAKASKPHPIYGENKKKAYDWDKKILFHGTLKYEPIEEAGEIGGRVEKQVSTITLVSKELYDKGVLVIDSRCLISVPERDGTLTTYNITERYGKVQLGNNHVFTKLEVVKMDDEEEDTDE